MIAICIKLHSVILCEFTPISRISRESSLLSAWVLIMKMLHYYIYSYFYCKFVGSANFRNGNKLGNIYSTLLTQAICSTSDCLIIIVLIFISQKFLHRLANPDDLRSIWLYCVCKWIIANFILQSSINLTLQTLNEFLRHWLFLHQPGQMCVGGLATAICYIWY